MKALFFIIMLLALAGCGEKTGSVADPTAPSQTSAPAPSATPSEPVAEPVAVAPTASPVEPTPSPAVVFPEKVTLEFSPGEDYTGRKLKEASGFDGSGFDMYRIMDVVQYWQETDAGFESAVEVNGRLYSLGLVSSTKESRPELMPTSMEFYPGIYTLIPDGGPMSLYLVTKTDVYEVLSLDVKNSSQVTGLANYYFWIAETGDIMRVDLERGEISFAKIDEISSLAHSLEPGMNVISVLDKDANVLAKYGLQENELILSGTPDITGSWSSITDYQRPENWRQIVKDSQFPLGETYLRGSFYGFRFSGYPMLDGSTVAVPMAMEFARQHLGLTESDLASFTSFSTTDLAYGNLIRRTMGQPTSVLRDKFEEGSALSDDEHAVDLILATYPSEAEMGIADYRGETLKIEKVCLDAFVFIVNKDNPVESLTLEQIRDIYAGKVTNWAEVGGEDAPIKPYQRDENSGSQTGMEQLVMKGEPMTPPERATIFMGMGELVNAVAEYDNGAGSIGYSYKYYVDMLYKSENIKILKIDGIEANQETMASETYPLAVGYYGVVRESDGPDSVGHKFLEWILSDEGQECVEQAGYVPIR